MKKHVEPRLVVALLVAGLVGSCGSDGPTDPPPAELVIVTESLPPARVGVAYSAGIDAEGGEGDYSWEILSGSIPTGLSSGVEDLSDDDLVISGTPERVGKYAFAVRVESADGQSASQTFELEVLAPAQITIETLVLPPALRGGIYGSRLHASGADQDQYEWTLVSGSLPPGLTLTADGLIEGNPSTLGTYTFTVRVVSGDLARTATFTIRVVPNDTSAFNITLLDVVDVPDDIRPHVLAAAERWEEVLAADLPAVALPEEFFDPEHCGGFGESADGTSMDDMLILVNIAPIDGVGKVLGRAGPCGIRNSTVLPFVGALTLDSDDLEPLVGHQTLTDIITHEMGHILGFGSLWGQLELSATADSANPTFVGERATAEYRALGGSGAVPLEEEGGEGTRFSHWDEETFGNELMTGFSERVGVGQPLSRLTIAAFEDMGYVVDYSVADAYSLGLLLRAEGSTALGNLGYDEVLTGPIRVLHEDGSITTLPRRPGSR